MKSNKTNPLLGGAVELAASRAIAREKAATANEMIPQVAPWSPALLRGYPCAVSRIEGVPHTFESIVGGFGTRKMSVRDYSELDFIIAEGESK